MRVLGIDFGAKRIGIAISDEDAAFAFPKETLPNDAAAIDRIVDISQREQALTAVLGDTRASTGGSNPITAEADRFAQALSARGVEVVRIWEAWSTVEASRFAPKGKEHDDAAAAAIILQRFLDSHPNRA